MGNSYFAEIINGFSVLNEVEAILLAGSRVTNTSDSLSDYDVYIYVNSEIPLDTREKLLGRHCSYLEVNNQYWETEDDGILLDGTEIELIYRGLEWLDTELARTLYYHQSSIGYSTCLWSNLMNSKVLFDRSGKVDQLIKKYRINYPDGLRKNIVDKNYPLLSSSLPAYKRQISKALKRNDAISVNHRVTEFLASYFDILFAINKLPHPGEKKLVEFSLSRCKYLPAMFEENINGLLLMTGGMNAGIPTIIDQLVANLTTLLQQEKLLVAEGVKT